MLARISVTDHSLLHLLQLTDSAFPIGAFAHSYGLETYVAQGRVSTPHTLEEFLRNTLWHAVAPSDGVACAVAYRADSEWEAVTRELDRRLTAMKGVTEFRQASRAMGVRLLRTTLHLMTSMALPGRQHGRLRLEFVRHNGQTAIARQRSAPPLQVFGLHRLPGSGGAYLQIVNPGGGLFGGDTAEVVVSVQEGAHVYLTTQAATKVYPAEHGHVSYQRTQLQVGPQAILEYFPLPLIPFARAAYAQETSIEVDPGGIGMIADVLAPGRAARGEYFGYRMLRSRMEGWVAGELALSEQMLLEPH